MTTIPARPPKVDPELESKAVSTAPAVENLAETKVASKRPAGESKPKVVPKKRSALVRDAIQLTRRAHLYAGLLLLPWVFLYGVTGLLFNHPTWFADTLNIAFGRSEMKGTAIESLLTPAQMAAAVLEQMNQGEEKYVLDESDKPHLGRGGLSATMKGADGKTYSVSMKAAATGGSIRELRGRGGAPVAVAPAAGATPPQGREGPGGGRGEGGARRGEGEGRPSGRREGRPGRDGGAPVDGEGATRPDGGPRPEGLAGGRSTERSVVKGSDAPFAKASGVELAQSPIQQLTESAATLMEKQGFQGAELASVQMAALEFQVQDSKNEVWTVTYDAKAGSIRGEKASEKESALAASLSLRRFLLNLHVAHGYPDEMSARSIWAVFVDIMGLTMIFWGISGIVMWWQIKRTRLVGALCLVFSTAVALWVGFEMHSSMIG